MKPLMISAVAAAVIGAWSPAAASAQAVPSDDGALSALMSAVTHINPTYFGTVGYADTSLDHADLGAVQVRLGTRLWRHVGVEAEGSWGVASDSKTIFGVGFPEKLSSQVAIYGVAYLPITPGFDLLARIGYGHTSGTGPQTVHLVHPDVAGLPTGPDSVHDAGVKGDSWNFGVGGQYMMTAHDGVRVDYLREDYRTWDTPNADVWSIAYLRRF